MSKMQICDDCNHFFYESEIYLNESYQVCNTCFYTRSPNSKVHKMTDNSLLKCTNSNEDMSIISISPRVINSMMNSNEYINTDTDNDFKVIHTKESLNTYIKEKMQQQKNRMWVSDTEESISETESIVSNWSNTEVSDIPTQKHKKHPTNSSIDSSISETESVVSNWYNIEVSEHISDKLELSSDEYSSDFETFSSDSDIKQESLIITKKSKNYSHISIPSPKSKHDQMTPSPISLRSITPSPISLRSMIPRVVPSPISLRSMIPRVVSSQMSSRSLPMPRVPPSTPISNSILSQLKNNNAKMKKNKLTYKENENIITVRNEPVVIEKQWCDSYSVLRFFHIVYMLLKYVFIFTILGYDIYKLFEQTDNNNLMWVSLLHMPIISLLTVEILELCSNSLPHDDTRVSPHILLSILGVPIFEYSKVEILNDSGDRLYKYLELRWILCRNSMRNRYTIFMWISDMFVIAICYFEIFIKFILPNISSTLLGKWIINKGLVSEYSIIGSSCLLFAFTVLYILLKKFVNCMNYCLHNDIDRKENLIKDEQRSDDIEMVSV